MNTSLGWDKIQFHFFPQVSLRQERQALLRGHGNAQEATPPSSPQEEAMSGVQQRLLLIPLTFILLRIWGTVQFIYSLARSKAISKHSCLDTTDSNMFFALGIAQVNILILGTSLIRGCPRWICDVHGGFLLTWSPWDLSNCPRGFLQYSGLYRYDHPLSVLISGVTSLKARRVVPFYRAILSDVIGHGACMYSALQVGWS